MDKAVWRERIETVLRDGYAPFIDGIMVPRWFTPAFAAAHPEVVAGFRARMIANDTRRLCGLRQRHRHARPAARIAAITAPTLIIVGADDPATPVAMSERIRALHPACRDGGDPQGGAHRRRRAAGRASTATSAPFSPAATAATRRATGGVSFDDGLANRNAVLGAEYVARAAAKAGDFGAPWQDFITRVAWGEIWGDPTLPWKTRSMLTLAMMTALHREEEFKLHFRAGARERRHRRRARAPC